MRLLLVEDHALVRAGLIYVLANEFPGAVVAEAENAAAAMQKAPSATWDLIVLDLDLPDRSGFDLIADLRVLAPKSRLLVMSGQEETEAGRRVLKSGAWGFIRKTSSNAEIAAAIRRVLSGKKHISSELAALILESSLDESVDSPHEALSAREFEVLRSLGQGLTVSQIAEKLGLSVKTVSTYRARLLEKTANENIWRSCSLCG